MHIAFGTVALCLTCLLPAQEVKSFRLWMAGQEAGGREDKNTTGPLPECSSREWVKLERLGMAVEQEVRQTARKLSDGGIEFTWYVQLSQQPMQGRAVWSPRQPRKITVTPKGMPQTTLDLPEEVVLWPLESEAKLKKAAQLRQGVRLRGFSPAMQKMTELTLQPVGPDPLPGFPDTVRFKGKSTEGVMSTDVEMWVSPTHGEIKDSTSFGGFDMLVQRATLPAPTTVKGPGLFERTLKPLPAHPFLPWLEAATLKWEGKGEQKLPQDAQQTPLGGSRYRVRLAPPLTAEEKADMPVKGKGQGTEVSYLAPSSLVQFQDPKFDGLVKALPLSPGASRWTVAQAVNRFVFDWILQKDYTVGFASALEVLDTKKGDCTEHGVLAVALLRKLGVPSRGVMGWVGLSGVMGLHFWVEVKLKDRWVSLDPSFNEAPASALRLKLADTDLADLGSVGWDAAAHNLAEGSWVPDGEWTRDVAILSDLVVAPGGVSIRFPKGKWVLQEGHLHLNGWTVEAVTASSKRQLAEVKSLQRKVGQAFWQSKGTLLLSVPGERWLAVHGLTEKEAVQVSKGLEVRCVGVR